MNTKVIAATVTGARHLRMARNGQDAAAVWAVGEVSAVAADEVAVAVVCDGCSAGASSEVGARLGATLFSRIVGSRLAAGASVSDRATWDGARRELVALLANLLDRMPGDRIAAIREHFL